MDWLLWLLLGGVVVGTGVALTSSAQQQAAAAGTPGATPGATPAAGGGFWELATGINPGDNVRMTMNPTVFAQMIASFPAYGTGKPAWIDLLSAMHWGLTGNGTQPIQAWGPGDALPTDWPTGDLFAATGYHAQYQYAGAQPVDVSSLPLTVVVWTKPGKLAGIAPTPVQAAGATAGQKVRAPVQTKFPIVPAPKPNPAPKPAPKAGTGAAAVGVVVVLSPGVTTAITVPAASPLTVKAPAGATIGQISSKAQKAIAVNAGQFTFTASNAMGTATNPALLPGTATSPAHYVATLNMGGGAAPAQAGLNVIGS
jgi:hypothetical protein